MIQTEDKKQYSKNQQRWISMQMIHLHEDVILLI